MPVVNVVLYQVSNKFKVTGNLCLNNNTISTVSWIHYVGYSIC